VSRCNCSGLVLGEAKTFSYPPSPHRTCGLGLPPVKAGCYLGTRDAQPVASFAAQPWLGPHGMGDTNLGPCWSRELGCRLLRCFDGATRRRS
jgi:hypothetical protein